MPSVTPLVCSNNSFPRRDVSVIVRFFTARDHALGDDSFLAA
jgi:hypothetical protein